ncbi:hypothetical protein OS493_024156 [Desmophyllum pertusum]|uniref:Uncharacterized protein n=1 Tax=Desmophyllum pertusum TaxID=174260 RepID=A0A9X0CXP8_9CNID|nr:hypothetical protein OS493_024156 [Desmophyllum pertusum]
MASEGCIAQEVYHVLSFPAASEGISRHCNNRRNRASGGNALALLYNGKAGQCLDKLRYQRYQEKLATKTTQIQPNSLPRHRLQQNSIVFACIPKSCNGKGKESMPKTGVEDERRPADSCDDGFTSSTRQPSTHSEMQLLIGMQHAAMFLPARHNLECSPACGQCKGSSSTNSSVLAQEDCGSDDDSNLASHDFLCISY